jgi:hypothetical protein
MACTPYGMCNSTITTLGCLREDHTMGCFPFLLTDTLEVPTSTCLYFEPESHCPVMSSTIPSYYYADPSPGCGLSTTASVCSLASPFVFCATSPLTSCCRFPMSVFWWLYALSRESNSMMAIIGACSSSSTNVALTSLTCGEGIVSTSTIPSL